jgi:hypothetical protein
MPQTMRKADYSTCEVTATALENWRGAIIAAVTRDAVGRPRVKRPSSSLSDLGS